MSDLKRCINTSYSEWGYHAVRCLYRAKFGEYCGVHSPSEKAKRRKARGPTQYERQCEARSQRRREEAAAINVVIEARRFIHKYRHPKTMELRSAINEYDAACREGE